MNVRYWSEEEHALFLEGMELYGKSDHIAIAQHVGTRTSVQVRSHAQKHFKALENHKDMKVNAPSRCAMPALALGTLTPQPHSQFYASGGQPASEIDAAKSKPKPRPKRVSEPRPWTEEDGAFEPEDVALREISGNEKNEKPMKRVLKKRKQDVNRVERSSADVAMEDQSAIEALLSLPLQAPVLDLETTIKQSEEDQAAVSMAAMGQRETFLPGESPAVLSPGAPLTLQPPHLTPARCAHVGAICSYPALF